MVETDKAGRSSRPAKVKVWDIAVRLFHWSLVISYTLAWLSADEWDQFHNLLGYIVGGLIGFRIVWGLVGTTHARFSDFVYAPTTVLKYLRDSMAGRAKRYLGHNPAGGAMVVAMLLALIGVTVSGIALTYDMFWADEWVEEIHEILANATLVLVALHIVGVFYASYEHKENLVKAMITGFKRRNSD